MLSTGRDFNFSWHHLMHRLTCKRAMGILYGTTILAPSDVQRSQDHPNKSGFEPTTSGLLGRALCHSATAPSLPYILPVILPILSVYVYLYTRTCRWYI